MIRVLIVDDSPMSLKNLSALLSETPAIEVVGTARNGREALAALEAAPPDVLCLDAHLPGTSGLELTREVMSRRPCPILILGSSSAATTALLEAGAMDVFPKPTARAVPGDVQSAALIARIQRLSRVPVIARRKRDRNPDEPLEREGIEARKSVAALGALSALRVPLVSGARAHALVAIGASTGGPGALMTILSALPHDFPYPVLCVQHISTGFLGELIEWLNHGCTLAVKIAREGETPQAGTIYFPQEDRHLEVDERGRLRLSAAARVDGHRPSVTATFESVARVCGARGIAVLLTGMGVDGARGLKSVRDAGGLTMAQNEATCAVFGMPGQAVALGAAQHVLAPPDIARKLLSLAKR